MADRYIPEHRRTQFKAKNAFKPEELRRRREEQQVEIRKTKREENLAKRRGIGTGERLGASLGAAPDSDDETAPTESQVSNFLLSNRASRRWRKAVCMHPIPRHYSYVTISSRDHCSSVSVSLHLFPFLNVFSLRPRARNATKFHTPSSSSQKQTPLQASTCVALTTRALLLSPALLEMQGSTPTRHGQRMCPGRTKQYFALVE